MPSITIIAVIIVLITLAVLVIGLSSKKSERYIQWTATPYPALNSILATIYELKVKQATCGAPQDPKCDYTNEKYDVGCSCPAGFVGNPDSKTVVLTKNNCTSIKKEIDGPLTGAVGKYSSTATNVLSPITCYRNRFDCDRIKTMADLAGIYDRLPIDDKKHYYSVLVRAINECKSLSA